SCRREPLCGTMRSTSTGARGPIAGLCLWLAAGVIPPPSRRKPGWLFRSNGGGRMKIVAPSRRLTRGVSPCPPVISQAENRRKRAPTFFREPRDRGSGDGRAVACGPAPPGLRSRGVVMSWRLLGGPAMSLSGDSRASAVLLAAQAGDRQAAADLLPLVYAELHDLARARLARQPPGQTLTPTALVNEVYLRIAGAREGTWGGRP